MREECLALALALALAAATWQLASSGNARLLTPSEWDGQTLTFVAMPLLGRGQECARAFPEYGTIAEELLKLWSANDGITLQLVLRAIHNHTLRRGHRHAGVAVGFRGGRAVLLDIPRLQDAFHWPGVLMRYLQVMVDLQEVFGHTLPDVDLVIALNDASPILKSKDRPGTEPPVLRYSRLPAVSPDILIPSFHSYCMGYNKLVKACVEHNSKHPWRARRNKALAR